MTVLFNLKIILSFKLINSLELHKLKYSVSFVVFVFARDEDDDQGLVLSTNDVGLRLRAMEYWKCAEVGLVTEEQTGSGAVSRLSLVIAEGLPPIQGSTGETQFTRSGRSSFTSVS